jgi:hypothetical protein
MMLWTHKKQQSGLRIRKPGAKSLILLASLVALGGGCAYRRNSPPEALVPAVPLDDAMQHRNWEQATAVYPNGSVVSGYNEFRYEPRRDMEDWRYAYADTGSFFVNMAMLPYNLYKHPQSKPHTYPGETIGPSYTVQPVMPEPQVYQPGTPPVIEPNGAAPSTPQVIEPGAPVETNVKSQAGGEAAPQPPAPPPLPPEVAPPPHPIQPQSAPTAVPAAPPPAAPALQPQVVAPAPPPPAPVAPPASSRGDGAAPSTPRVIESPPPAALKNLAPPIEHTAPPAPPPATQPYLNK